MAETKTTVAYSVKAHLKDTNDKEVTASYSGVKETVALADIKAVADAIIAATAQISEAPVTTVSGDIIKVETTITSEEFAA